MIKTTAKTYKEIDYFACSKRTVEQNRLLLLSLYDDLNEINNLLVINGYDMQLRIDYENNHTEYSPERVDPCPDFYGCFTLSFEHNQNEIIGDIMTIDELDQALFIIIGFYKNLINKNI
jgi:hypothetical protein